MHTEVVHTVELRDDNKSVREGIAWLWRRLRSFFYRWGAVL
jgi:hypothetical protein